MQLFVDSTSTTNVVRLDVNGDSDQAGCLKTRKSTTGMVLLRDAHCLKVSGHTQSTVSLSNGKSEYYGTVTDFGMCADFVVRTDSSSGLAVARIGSSQQRAQQGVRLKKKPDDTNVSDALTKSLDEICMTNLLAMMGYEFKNGRTSSASGQHDNRYFFSSMVFPAARFFESSGVAQ